MRVPHHAPPALEKCDLSHEKSFYLKIMHLLFYGPCKECWIFSETDMVLQKGNQ